MIHVNSYRLKNKAFPPAATLLAKELGAKLISTGTPPPNTINWGRRLPTCQRSAELVFNSHAPIPKFEAFLLLEKAEVSVPEFQTLNNWIVRSNRHAQGRDILRHGEAFLVKAIDKKKEVRFDVRRRADDSFSVFRLHVKTPLDPDAFVWNRGNTAWHSYGPRDMVAQLGDRQPIELAKQALAALDYDFGAVDLVQGQDDKWFVLEVNSAPNLKEVGAAKYAARLRELLKEPKVDGPETMS